MAVRTAASRVSSTRNPEATPRQAFEFKLFYEIAQRAELRHFDPAEFHQCESLRKAGIHLALLAEGLIKSGCGRRDS